MKTFPTGSDLIAHSTDQNRGVRLLALVAGVLLIACAGCQTNTYTHSKFRQRTAHLTNVVFLPPRIRTGIASNLWVTQLSAQLPEESKIRAELPEVVAEEFRKRGLRVTEFTPAALLSNSTNLVWDARMERILNNAHGNVGLKAIRPEAPVLAAHVQAGGLVFLNVFAYESTEGRKAKAAFGNTLGILAAAGGKYGGQWTPFSQAIVMVALVDGETGDVLWRTTNDFTDLDKTGSAEVVAQLFKKYPKR